MKWLRRIFDPLIFFPLYLLSPPTRRERAARKYFGQIDSEIPAAHIDDIVAAIARDGAWSESAEWRISTVMESSIEPIIRDGATWYRVNVGCCYEFSCECPTLARAVQFQWIFAGMICDLFWNLGWPSWSCRIKV